VLNLIGAAAFEIERLLLNGYLLGFFLSRALAKPHPGAAAILVDE
jgi:hypothetical protein